MRVSQHTRRTIAQAKAESHTTRKQLAALHASLSEHPGTKMECKRLEVVIRKLDEWARM